MGNHIYFYFLRKPHSTVENLVPQSSSLSIQKWMDGKSSFIRELQNVCQLTQRAAALGVAHKWMIPAAFLHMQCWCWMESDESIHSCTLEQLALSQIKGFLVVPLSAQSYCGLHDRWILAWKQHLTISELLFEWLLTVQKFGLFFLGQTFSSSIYGVETHSGQIHNSCGLQWVLNVQAKHAAFLACLLMLTYFYCGL